MPTLNEVHHRQLEIEALRTQRNQLLLSLEESEDGDEDVLREVEGITVAMGRHKREIEGLQGLREVEVSVTESKRQERVVLPTGIRVRVPCLSDGELLWSPPSSPWGGDLEVTDSTDSVVVRRTLLLVKPVQGDFLHQWGTQGGREGQFCFPVDVAANSDEVFVTDPRNNRIQVFSLDGTFVRKWGTRGDAEGQFRSPAGIAIKGEEVFVAEHGNRIQVFKLDGFFLRQWGTTGEEEGQFRNPGGVAVNNEEVFVCDTLNHRIQVFRLDGTFLRQWGTNGDGEGQFVLPACLVVRDQEVIVSDFGNHNIQVFGLDGTFVRRWGTEGSGEGQFARPFGVAVKGEEVIVSDSDSKRIQVFWLDGTFVRQWSPRGNGEKQADFLGLTGLTVVGDRVIVCDRTGHSVHVFVGVFRSDLDLVVFGFPAELLKVIEIHLS